MLRYFCIILVSTFIFCQTINTISQIDSIQNTRWENGVKVIKLTSLNLDKPAVQNQAKSILLNNNHQNDLTQITTQSEIKHQSLLIDTPLKQNNSISFKVRQDDQDANNLLSKIALQCKTVYLPDLDACIPFSCPQKYEWNQQLRQCRLPTPQCSQNFSWNGAVCLPAAALSVSQIQKVFQQFQKNRFSCLNGESKCQKKVCPQGFTWIESSCVPKNSQQKCPTSNLINGICQPSYSVEITIKPACISGINQWNGTACIPIPPVFNSVKQNPIYLTSNQVKIKQEKQLLPQTTSFTSYSNVGSNKLLNPSSYLLNRQLPTSFFATSDYLNQYFTRSSNLFTPQIQNKIPYENVKSPLISTNKIQQIDLRVPGVVTPKIITPPAPSFVPQAQPRYII